MINKNSNKLTNDELIKLIDKVKTYSGCSEVELTGCHKTFEELIKIGFPLTDFKCNEEFKLDTSQLYIIPVGEHSKNIKIIFEE